MPTVLAELYGAALKKVKNKQITKRLRLSAQLTQTPPLTSRPRQLHPPKSGEAFCAYAQAGLLTEASSAVLLFSATEPMTWKTASLTQQRLCAGLSPDFPFHPPARADTCAPLFACTIIVPLFRPFVKNKICRLSGSAPFAVLLLEEQSISPIAVVSIDFGIVRT